MFSILIDDETKVRRFNDLPTPCFFYLATKEGERKGELHYVPGYKTRGKALPYPFVVYTGCLNIQITGQTKVLPVDVHISTK